MGYHVLEDHETFLAIAILVSESSIFQRWYIYSMYESMYEILLFDQHLPGPIRLVLLVIGWLVTQFSQKRL